jgi:hypothetical protein
MDITTLAAWGEFLGGIAVVLSLVYLASQVQQNSKLLRASAASTTAQLHVAQNQIVIQDAESSRLFYRGIEDLAALSKEDNQRFQTMIGIQVQAMHQSYEFHQRGIDSEASWYWTQNGMRWFAAQPGFHAWWRENRSGYMPSFGKYVDDLISEGEDAG